MLLKPNTPPPPPSPNQLSLLYPVISISHDNCVRTDPQLPWRDVIRSIVRNEKPKNRSPVLRQVWHDKDPSLLLHIKENKQPSMMVMVIMSIDFSLLPLFKHKKKMIIKLCPSITREKCILIFVLGCKIMYQRKRKQKMPTPIPI